jgi:hypothetical protein
MVAILNKYPDLVDSIHFSDQVSVLKTFSLCEDEL